MNESNLAVTQGFADLVWTLREVVKAVAEEMDSLTLRRIAAE